MDPNIQCDGDACAWWDEQFAARRALTIDNTALVGELADELADGLVDVPVLLALDPERIDYQRTAVMGRDLRFVAADGVTKLAHEIEAWIPGGRSLVWLMVPRIPLAGESAPSLWMYYDNPNAQDGQDPSGVWAGYTSVHHFAGDFLDSTGNGHDGVSSEAPDPDEGVIAGAMHFDGEDDYLELLDEASFDFGAQMSIEVWIKVERFDRRWQTVVAKGNDSWRLHRDDRADHLEFGTTRAGNYHDNFGGSEGVADSRWHHAAVVYNGQTKTIYIDGRRDRGKDYSQTLQNSSYPVYVGENSQAEGRFFSGSIDELRIAGTARSAAWISTQYRAVAEATLSRGSPDRPLVAVGWEQRRSR